MLSNLDIVYRENIDYTNFLLTFGSRSDCCVKVQLEQNLLYIRTIYHMAGLFSRSLYIFKTLKSYAEIERSYLLSRFTPCPEFRCQKLFPLSRSDIYIEVADSTDTIYDHDMTKKLLCSFLKMLFRNYKLAFDYIHLQNGHSLKNKIVKKVTDTR